MSNYNVVYSNSLSHHGIKGQKWGIRRWQNEDGSLTPEGVEHYGKTYKTNINEYHDIQTKTKYGQDVTLEEVRESKIAKWLSKHFESVYERQLNSPMWNIKVDEKNVGEISLFQESEDSVNVSWLGVREEGRGKGIATAALDAVIADVKSKGYKQMTLEVPGHSPDARHIYESRGFVVNEALSEDDVWDGLTSMTLKFDDSLEHHGILGQKWGVRRFQNEDGSYTAAGKERYSEDSKPSNGEPEKSGKKFDLRNLTPEQKKAIKTGAIIAGSALLMAGGLYLASQLESPMPSIKRITVGQPLSEGIKNFSTDSVRVKKNTTFQRISSEAVEDYTKTGQAYVSYLTSDNLTYKRFFSSEGNKDNFVHKLKLNKEISAPSEKETAEIFLKFNPKAKTEDFDHFMTYAFLHENKNVETISGVNRNDFVKEVKRRGYDALIDTNDSNWTKSPLILLNPSELVASNKSRKIGTFEKVILQASSLL